MGIFDGTWLHPPCPRCGYELEVTFLQARLEETVICPCCKVNVRLVDQDAGLEVATREIGDALSQLRNTLKRLH